jgi:alpha-L-rhamnosidase
MLLLVLIINDPAQLYAQNNYNQYRQSTLKAKVFPTNIQLTVGRVDNAHQILSPDGKTVRLVYPKGGEKPYLILDMGSASVGGYPVFKVASKKGNPTLRIAYACWYPYLVDSVQSQNGDFRRMYTDTYLGFDLPVLPGNPGRYELYTISRTGEFMHPLIQGQERWVRIQLDTEDTEIELEYFYIQNVHDYSDLDGYFLCSDNDFNRLWYASSFTAQFASIDNSNPLDIVNGWLAPRKLKKSDEVFLAKSGKNWYDYKYEFDFEIRKNPWDTSGVGWAFRAVDEENTYLAKLTLDGKFELSKRVAGKVTTLKLLESLPTEITDGKIYHAKTSVNKNQIKIFIDGNEICSINDKTFKKGKVGFYMSTEHWALIDNVKVTAADGKELLSDQFDSDLSNWNFHHAPPFICDGSLRDRLPWIGDLDWAAYQVYYAFNDTRFVKGTLEIFANHQTPEGYVWPTAFPENTNPPKSGDWGYWPSDEYSAWFVPTVANYLLYTGDVQTAKVLFPAVKKDLKYLFQYMDTDGLFNQREETRRGQGVGGDFGGFASKKFAYMNLLLYYALDRAAYLAAELNLSDDSKQYSEAAIKLKQAIFKNLWDEDKGYFVTSPTERTFHYRSNGLALFLGIVTNEQAATMIPEINQNLSYSYSDLSLKKRANVQDVGGLLTEKYGFQSGKFLTHSIAGRFIYGADNDAVESIRKSAWIKILNDWRGVQGAIWESTIYPPFRPTGEGYRDMSHADNACAQLFSGYILGVIPVETGYRKFTVIPHPSGLEWAEGEVPTPCGNIRFEWSAKCAGDTIFTEQLTVPEGTNCDVAVPKKYVGNLTQIFINNDLVFGTDGFKPGKTIKANEVDQNYLYFKDLPSGDYQIVVIKSNKHKIEN